MFSILASFAAYETEVRRSDAGPGSPRQGRRANDGAARSQASRRNSRPRMVEKIRGLPSRKNAGDGNCERLKLSRPTVYAALKGHKRARRLPRQGDISRGRRVPSLASFFEKLGPWDSLPLVSQKSASWRAFWTNPWRDRVGRQQAVDQALN